jgi:co-chaperonin GroES (HSP10)
MKKMSQTKWKPCGNKILVEMDPVEEVTKGGIVIPGQKTERDAMAQMVGTIVAVGDCAWGDQPHKWAKPGDKVKFAKYAGFLHKEEGSDTLYRVMHDLDIVMVLPKGDR